jgi:hypothetical protein
MSVTTLKEEEALENMHLSRAQQQNGQVKEQESELQT